MDEQQLNRSSTIAALAAALSAFQGEVESIKKDADNPFFKSKYASLENIIATTRATLAKHGLAVTQLPIGDNELTTILLHKSGEFIETTVRLNAKDRTPQAIGSAITYMRRYTLSAILGLATDEDDDGNHATHKAATATVKKMLPDDPFAAAKIMVERSRTIEDAIAVSERVANSDKFTDEQKQEIKRLATKKVDAFDASQAPEIAPQTVEAGQDEHTVGHEVSGGSEAK